MRNFPEILQDCINNKDNSELFRTYYEELCGLEEVKILKRNISHDRALKKYTFEDIKEENIDGFILETTKKYKPSKNIKLENFKQAVIYRIQKFLETNRTEPDKIRQKVEKLKKDQGKGINTDSRMHIFEAVSKDDIYSDSNETYEEQLYVSLESPTENNAEDKEKQCLMDDLLKVGLKEDSEEYIIISYVYDVVANYNFKSLEDLVKALNVNKDKQTYVKWILRLYSKKCETLYKLTSSIFSFDVYEKIVEYLLEPNNKQLKTTELIKDFSKIRNYLSVLVYNDDINDKQSFVQKCDFGSLSTYEKEIHRILSLFKYDNIFDFKKELKEKTPNYFSKIYEIHAVPNLVLNFLILDVMQEDSSELRLSQIAKLIIPENSKNNLDENTIKNFKKYALLPRLNEMKEYGFIITKGNGKDTSYILNMKLFLTDEQKQILKYAIPFFCGIYPFPSIGHFLANRLDIKDIFRFEAYNINNVLDDCVTYDLLYAINHNMVIDIKLKTDKAHKKIKPTELHIEKEKSLLKDNKKFLLKVKCTEGEYYLHDIDKIDIGGHYKNPVFSEIYSFYYKIYEEIASEYKKDINYNINKSYEKYGSTDTRLYFDTKIAKKLSGMKNIALPLTTLELRWLKTIMQDPRFELFVTEKEKQSLDNLVNDVETFDLSKFKIFDYKENKYMNIINENLIRKTVAIDKNDFRNKLAFLNSSLYSLKDHSFKWD